MAILFFELGALAMFVVIIAITFYTDWRDARRNPHKTESGS